MLFAYTKKALAGSGQFINQLLEILPKSFVLAIHIAAFQAAVE